MATLLEVRTELKARGFSRFVDADLNRYINWGRNRIARRMSWFWERKTQVINIVAGVNPVLDLTTVTDFGSVAKVMLTTAGQRRTLKPMEQPHFESEWLPLDLTLSQYRSEPTRYYLHGNTLYILPPPLTTRAGIMEYHAKLAAITVDGTNMGLHAEADDAIVTAALIYCHQRAHELDEAAYYEMQLERFIDDSRTEESMRMEEEVERVLPDDTWL